ncbi:MAG: BACON domain-containing carbohydrate-binding protein [Bryobacteraceae bacterium]
MEISPHFSSLPRWLRSIRILAPCSFLLHAALATAATVCPAPRLAAGGSHSLSVRSDGTVWAWGGNANGQLGDGSLVTRFRPVQALGPVGVTGVSAGELHSLAVAGDGQVWSWGGNASGQLGTGGTADRSKPAAISGLTSVVAVAAGGSHSLALRSDGTVWAWGFNGQGQIGNGTLATQFTPVQIASLSGVVAIAAGQSHSLAVRSDGSVWAWGANTTGQLADANAAQRTTPQAVAGFTGAVCAAGGGGHTLALKADGTVWAWGSNLFGQLGDGTGLDQTAPVRSGTLIDVAGISSGNTHNLVWKTDGTVWGFGFNASGQLGDGTLEAIRLLPVRTGLNTSFTGAASVAAGFIHGLAAKPDESIWAWGVNLAGQFGSGLTPTDSIDPVLAFRHETCSSVLTPSAAAVGSAGGSASVGITATGGCTWTAYSNADWLTITSGDTGAGSGTVNYTVAPNVLVFARTGTLTIAGRTFVVTQSGSGCTSSYLLSPGSALIPALGGSGSVGVAPESPGGCPWTAVSNAGWITVTAGASGAGNGTVNFSVAGNGGAQRVGTISIAGQTFTVTQQAGGVGGLALPAVGVPNPSSGSGMSGVFQFPFSDGDGAADLNILNVLINNAIDGRNACYIAFVRATGELLLVNDAGAAGGPFAGSMIIPGSGSVSNGQCSIQAAGSSVLMSGNTLTLTLNMSFTTGFAGRRVMYLAARDNASNNTGWHAKGVWNVPGGTPAGNGTSVVSLAPARVAAATVALTAVFSDTAGFADLNILNILINDGIDGRNACYLAFVRSTGQLLLVNDAGDAGGPFAGAINIPGAGSVNNSQCTINAAGSSVSGAGNTLTLTLNMSFQQGFAGDRIVHAAARDTGGNNTGWQAMGTITIP